MSSLEPRHVIEAALLSAGRPLSVRELRRLFGDRLSAKTVRSHLEALRAFWSERGMRLSELSDGWRFSTAPEIAQALLALEPEKAPRYSRAAMETLAIIAYRQPVTRGDIEDIRGVAVNPAIIRAFEERGWIETVGRRDTPGRPELLGTTRQFLDDLGLRSLEELPALPESEKPEFALSLPAEAGGGTPLQKEIDFEKHD